MTERRIGRVETGSGEAVSFNPPPVSELPVMRFFLRKDKTAWQEQRLTVSRATSLGVLDTLQLSPQQRYALEARYGREDGPVKWKALAEAIGITFAEVKTLANGTFRDVEEAFLREREKLV